MITMLNVQNEKVLKFKEELFNELNGFYQSEEEFDYEYHESFDELESLFSDENAKLIGYVKDDKVIMLTKVYEAADVTSRDNWFLKLFDGMISKLYYLYNKVDEIQEELEDFFTQLSELYPNIILYSYHLNYSHYKESYEWLSLQSTLDEKYSIVLDGEYVISEHCSIDLHAELAKKQQVKVIKSLETIVLNNNEGECIDSFKKELSLLLQSNKPGSSIAFDGFSYFNPSDIFSYHQPENLHYIVAKATFEDESTDIVGVLKIADYVLTDKKNYIGLNYINVHSAYYQKGIAKELYKVLDMHLNNLKNETGEEPIFISSSLSEMGEKVRIDKTRNKIVKSVLTFSDIKEYTLYMTKEKQPN